MMDVLIELLDNADNDDILHAIHSSIPVDYYILLIDHTFSQDWAFIGTHTYRRGKYHSFNDLPAEIYSNGTQCWYKHGLYHRDNDLPAMIEDDGTQIWFQHNELHRDNGLPAVIASDGYKAWYKRGVRLMTSYGDDDYEHVRQLYF